MKRSEYGFIVGLTFIILGQTAHNNIIAIAYYTIGLLWLIGSAIFLHIEGRR